MKIKTSLLMKPDYYALEYELQFALKLGESLCTTHLAQRSRRLIPLYSLNLGDRRLELNLEPFNKLADKLWEESKSRVAMIDVGNLEIRNRFRRRRIDLALKELQNTFYLFINWFLDDVQFPYEFALFLPQIQASDRGYTCSKHVNFSFSSANKRLISENIDFLQHTYSHYFQRLGVRQLYYGISKKDIARKGSWTRLHLKLPYTFSDIKGLWEGTAKLPTYQDILRATQEKKELAGYGAIPLGYSQEGNWIEKNKLI